ncbi:hypothetical protein NVP1187O_093 [Vibrio phage 1.187.O._10N.286.49.F1]|nr:hypothetical protein NVP1187O_093 [Vibrio phage 1.187.O._10N.286.49.F1]
MKYVIKREGVFDDYILMVADVVNYGYDDIDWDFYKTDNPQDATKFCFSCAAYEVIMDLGLDKEEWVVFPLEGSDESKL